MLNIPIHEVKKFLIIFYIVGFIGFTLPYTRPWFEMLIPLALFMNIGLLLFYHKPRNIKSYSILALIATISWSVEAIGVETGILFGSYTYGQNLGPKPLDTPILIGLNWMMLSYCVFVVLPIKNKTLSVLTGAALLTVYDYILEPVAIFMDMWSWAKNSIPTQNYIMWFILAILLFSILNTQKKYHNPIAKTTIILQTLFFLALNLFTRFI